MTSPLGTFFYFAITPFSYTPAHPPPYPTDSVSLRWRLQISLVPRLKTCHILTAEEVTHFIRICSESRGTG
ncbi:hypothetical protein PBY51_005883 [Eleginops maclovinus]|uniref:Uncharacterized protein n=1 Tax=Eleginops maclovinus TaxID=56733 RepID=A0AAN7WDG4_ELEMC|nr:hypothetical protein PBY51_005883 [Eleginops maclovinus]